MLELQSYVTTSEARKHVSDSQWSAWESHLSMQQEHECPADCKGEGCHIPLQPCDCPTDWKHGL
jgi:hypothetical protein